MPREYSSHTIKEVLSDIESLGIFKQEVSQEDSKTISFSSNCKQYEISFEMQKLFNTESCCHSTNLKIFISCNVFNLDRKYKPTYYFLNIKKDFEHISEALKYLFSNKENEIISIQGQYFHKTTNVTKEYVTGKYTTENKELTNLQKPTLDFFKKDFYSFGFTVGNIGIKSELRAVLISKDKKYIAKVEFYSENKNFYFSEKDEVKITIEETNNQNNQYKNRIKKPNIYHIKTMTTYSEILEALDGILRKCYDKNIAIDAVYFKDDENITKQLLVKDKIINF